ncbi:MAG TPA: DEAD/DEAH box helicase, partial [Ktedonobacterales bacterium]|nr:DEAD/DEAH box helicase [Ktedonobacterales bacterium]
AQAARHHDARARFEPLYLPSARTLDTNALLSALTDGSAWAIACLRASRPTPQDGAILRRDELDSRLAQAESLLPRVADAASALAESCGLPAPETMEASAALAEIAGCLLDTPQPPASWLDADTFAGVRALALDASMRAFEARRVRDALESLYTPAFFMLDVPGLAQRFSSDYAGVLRVFKPGYHADMKRVRATLRPGQTRDTIGICADLAAARALLGEERRLREASVEHARAFGRFYNGEATDWAALRAAVDWTTRFHTLVPAYGVAPEVTRLATAPASGRTGLRGATDALAGLLEEWQEVGAALGALVKPGMLAEGARSLEAAPVDTLLAGLARLHDVLRAYWQAVDAVAPHLRPSTGAGAPPWESLCACLRLAAELNTLDSWLAVQEGGLRHDLGVRYAGWETNWSEAEAALTWVEVLLDIYPQRKMPNALRGMLAEGGDAAARERLHVALESTRGALTAVEAELGYSDTVLPRAALLESGKTQPQTAVAAMRERVAFHLENLPCLERWLECAGYRADCAALGLGEVVRAALRMRPFPRDIVGVFEKRFYQLWLDAVRRECPALARFSGDTHEQTIARFRELDANHQQLARRRLAAQLHQERVDAVHVRRQQSDDDLTRGFTAVRREVNKKRHRSIRQIVATMAPAMLLLKPCWLMSPLSVSQYVESPDALFDVVIFDEASQVCPEDAICAILRGNQLIVVGDSKQLPPTRFFTKTLADATDDTEDDDDEAKIEDERTPSILEECEAAGFPPSQLLWHYRSRHEALIAFSNAHFYTGRLQTFPGPQAQHEDGVRFVYVEDGRYDKGRSRQNRREAERVVDLILEHVRERPELSLGVVALSEAQQRAINDALERRLKQNADLRAAYEDALDE